MLRVALRFEGRRDDGGLMGNEPSPFAQHHFVSTLYGPRDARLTLGALEALCAAARAGGARSIAVVNAEPGELVYGMPQLRITWSD